jgi:hypothetical protein
VLLLTCWNLICRELYYDGRIKIASLPFDFSRQRREKKFLVEFKFFRKLEFLNSMFEYSSLGLEILMKFYILNYFEF